MATTLSANGNSSNNAFKDKEKPMAVRTANIMAARAVADAIRTSLGPRGMDKMIQTGKGETIITNDGNTMLKDMAVMHPAAKMLVDLSAAQDVEAGDGTTSVVVIAGSLLGAADRLLAKGTAECQIGLSNLGLTSFKAYIPRSFPNLSNEQQQPQLRFFTTCHKRSPYQTALLSSKPPRHHCLPRLSHNTRTSLGQWPWTLY